MDNCFMQVMETECSECHAKTNAHYTIGKQWWDKFLKPEEKLCPNCMVKREGFVEAFHEATKLTWGEYLKLNQPVSLPAPATSAPTLPLIAIPIGINAGAEDYLDIASRASDRQRDADQSILNAHHADLMKQVEARKALNEQLVEECWRVFNLRLSEKDAQLAAANARADAFLDNISYCEIEDNGNGRRIVGVSKEIWEQFAGTDKVTIMRATLRAHKEGG